MLKKTLLCVLLLSLAAFAQKPNVIVILADDMGSGDVQALNRASVVPTPSLNTLSEEGVTFTNAHTNSAVCTPTRYGLMTGRYCWRSRLKKGVLNGYSTHLIDPNRFTIADLFKSKGYKTAMIGKWHLGMDLPLKGKNQLDLNGTVKNGPCENGFDEFWGITASLDFPPYVFIENDKIDATKVENRPASKFPAFWRAGETDVNFVHEKVCDQLTERTVKYIADKAAKKEPFFIYMPLPSPHKPTHPAKRFIGKSGIGLYGDYVMQTDWIVGQVMKAVKDGGIDENTMIIYTSDNGSYMNLVDSPYCPKDKGDVGHKTNPKIQGYLSTTHRANGPYRGTKADIYESGHRVPFFVRYPGAFKGGQRTNELISIVDIFATCADVIGEATHEDAEDSFSFKKLLEGQAESFKRPPIITHSHQGTFAIHDKNWKLIAGKGSGGRTLPKSKAFDKPYQLYDLDADIAEENNLIEKNPEKAQEMEKTLQAIIKSSEAYK
ncbi:MAG: arylsulfatase [Lentisphaerales bacterium]|nr:arylsulfatase [Lentisphaerales bacterium]